MNTTGKPSGSSSSGRSGPRPRRAPLVLVDTNALFLPFTGGLGLEEEIGRWVPGARIAVSQSVVGELDRLVARGVPNAVVARALASRFERVPSEESGDSALLAVARRRRAAVVTADRGLRDRLVAAGLTVYIPRVGGRLEPYRRRARSSSSATVKNGARLEPVGRRTI